MKKDSISKSVYNFITKNEIGFLRSEIETLLEQYPDVNLDTFNNTLGTATCMSINGEIIIYKSDVELVLRCLIEDRDINTFEFD